MDDDTLAAILVGCVAAIAVLKYLADVLKG